MKNKKRVFNRQSIEEKKQRLNLFLLFSLFILCIILVSLLISGFLLYLLLSFGIINVGRSYPRPMFAFLFVSGISFIVGSFLTAIVSRFSLRPINRMIDQMNRLAHGDFNARLDFGKPICDHPAFREISDSFNTMAKELQNTEVLRSDFINNFSHEFKTPIVSIAGFAKLLRRGNITDGQRLEYLTVIEEESLRLASMATNVLNLTKVENQTILTDVSEYNLSEQIRSCVLLFEDKWAKKKLELILEFSEYSICANRELLKQVWINLIDNAVKFTPDYGTVDIRINKTDNGVTVKVTNTGSEISPEKQGKIFNKFYQGDESHATNGNGIGLAIVKRVTELHGGNVYVESGAGITSFTVMLPN